MSDFQQHRDRVLAVNPEAREEYDRLGMLYTLVSDLIGLRHLRGLTQEQLAQRLGKQQPAIARLESARVTPSLTFLREVAEALDAELVVRLKPRRVAAASPARSRAKAEASSRSA